MENYKGIISTSGTIFGSLIAQKGPKGDTGEKGSTGEKGEKGDQGYTPQKGLDYFTEQDKQEFIEELTLDIHNEKEAFNQNVDNKTNEFNQNASNKMKEFNQNVSAKTEEMINQVVEVEAMVKRINISGASKQETREGYNLVDFSNPTNKSAPYSFENDILVVSSSYQYANINWDLLDLFKTNAGKTVYFKSKEVDSSNAISPTAQLTITNNGTNSYINLFNTLYTIPTDTSNLTKATFGIYCNNSSTDTASSITITEPMLVFEENTEKPYEQYGVSPSIDSEAPIESVGDNTNLYNPETMPLSNGLWINQNTSKIVSNSGGWYVIFPCFPKSTYTISRKNSRQLTSSISFVILETEELPIKDLTYLNSIIDHNATEKTITTSSDTKYLLLLLGSGSGIDDETKRLFIEELKICKGTSTGAYSPYGQGSIEIYNCNKNWFNKEAITESYYLNQGNGVLGSSTSSNVSDYIPVIANETYIVTYDYETLVASGKRGYCYSDKNKTYLKGSEYTSSNKAFTLTPTEDGYIRFAYDKNCTNIMVRKRETSTDYVEHKSQTKALYTQQPFRAIGDVKDRFVKQNGIWYEEHKNLRYIFTGDEEIGIPNTSVGDGITPFRIRLPFDNKIHSEDYCAGLSNRLQIITNSNDWLNNLKNSKNIGVIVVYSNVYTALYLRIDSNVASTIEEFKEYLQANELYIDFPLATPTLIPCKSEQVEVLNDIYSAYGEGMTNIICNDEIEPVIEIVKETKETVQSENDKAISMLLARIEALEKALIS